MALPGFLVRPSFYMNTAAIKKIANRSRRNFEIGTINRELLIELYREYKDVGDVSQFVSIAKNIFPQSNCGLASLYLKKKLGGKVVRGKYGKHNHTFLLVENIVIDITADQFGGPRVYVGPLQLPWALRKNYRNATIGIL